MSWTSYRDNSSGREYMASFDPEGKVRGVVSHCAPDGIDTDHHWYVWKNQKMIAGPFEDLEVAKSALLLLL